MEMENLSGTFAGMKLFDDRRTPNPRRVRIFLAEKGIEIPLERVDIMAGGHRTPEFTAINPLQRIPVLILKDGSAIAETMAICRYIEALQPEPALFGRTPIEIARVEMWNRRAEYNLFFAVAQAARHLVPALVVLEDPQIPAWGEANKPRALQTIGVFDEALSRHRFLAGDTFSVADITAFAATDFMRLARIAVPDEAVHFKRWLAEVSSRPSASA